MRLQVGLRRIHYLTVRNALFFGMQGCAVHLLFNSQPKEPDLMIWRLQPREDATEALVFNCAAQVECTMAFM